jgi:hypothetical protein
MRPNGLVARLSIIHSILRDACAIHRSFFAIGENWQ